MSVYDILKKWNVKDYKLIDEQAIKDITLGASILATGGGGDPEIGLLWSLNVLKEGKDIVLIEPEDFPDDAIACIAANLGAPVVLTEKPPSGDEVRCSLEGLRKYLGHPVEAIIPPEAGGVNTPVPMAVAGVVGIPVVDADGMGRAFPELQMTSFYTHGITPSPTASSNEKGAITIADTKDGIMTEHIIRNSAMAYGGNSWIAGYPMTGKQLKNAAIFNSVSKCWELGRAVYECRKHHTDPIERVSEILGGTEIFKGKVVDINREFGAEKTKGFSMGVLTIEGIGKDKGSNALVSFQNEWLRLEIDGEVKCLPPDLILILDSETGEPIRTDIVKYGYRGSIVVVPADKKMRTEEGIKAFGPKYFGYAEDYVPVEKLINA